MMETETLSLKSVFISFLVAHVEMFMSFPQTNCHFAFQNSWSFFLWSFFLPDIANTAELMTLTLQRESFLPPPSQVGRMERKGLRGSFPSSSNVAYWQSLELLNLFYTGCALGCFLKAFFLFGDFGVDTQLVFESDCPFSAPYYLRLHTCRLLWHQSEVTPSLPLCKCKACSGPGVVAQGFRQ